MNREVRHILVVEDEPNVAAFIKKGLDEAGFFVWLAYNGDQGLELLRQKTIDLVILDVILPGSDGLTICREIRKSWLDIPVLMLTALGTTDNIVNGLNAGADDYLVKPFKFKELIARVEALFRRKNLGKISSDTTLKLGDLELDREGKTVRRGGKILSLTGTEYRLLEYMMVNKNRILSRMDILENVWDINFNLGTNVVDVYVNYLRNKIDKGQDVKLIHTVIGLGYVMKDSV